jgi:murein DD-endopeptidase MepM/ murein hydrolase activator NlpD
VKYLAGILAIPAVFIAGIIAFVVLLSSPPCGATGISVNAGALPDQVGQFQGEQLQNAAAVVNAGANLGVTIQAQTLALAAAIGQSDLINLDGDPAGLGVFKAPDAAPWGSAENRRNVTIASLTFYRELASTDGWEDMLPTLAVNSVLRTADPYAFEGAYQHAVTLITAFGGTQPSCTGGPAGEVNTQGWAKPVDGRLGDGYGPRESICTNGYCSKPFHSGADVEASTGTPIYALRGGIVSAAGPNGSYGNWIVIDHGGGIVSTYAHMYGDGVFVAAGQRVTAGQNIGEVGCSGVCTGPHLHLEISVDGVRVDPIPFLRNVGVTWN